MCGIVGSFYYRSPGKPDAGNLGQATELLGHRGPDNRGFYSDNILGLGHTRLSLLDLNPRSNQPFWDSSGRYAIVYNGEIYNFLSLKTELEKQGICFLTTSDTEVLLYGLIHWGVEKTLQKIEGMYAFGFYDKIEQSLILARDKYGIKPLYYSDTDGVFVFASEIKAMSPWLTFEPDLFSISSYLQGFGGPTQGYTFFKHVQIAAPGTIITVKRGLSPQFKRFFRLSDMWDPALREELDGTSPQKLVDLLDQKLSENVRQMLIADAPVGALCSGGLDSSVIMAMAAKHHHNLAIFHADVKGKYSESHFAEMLARHLKLDLLKVNVGDMDFIRYMPEVLYHYGHPFSYHPNSIPFIQVSKLVRQHNVKAVLSGEGADECFYGYPWVLFNTIARAKDIFYSPYKYLKALLKRSSRTSFSNIENYNFGCSILNRLEKEVEEKDILDRLKAAAGKAIEPKEFTSFQMLGYHLRTLLHRNDALGMAAGIEARFPFLDSDTVKFAVNLPYSHKVRFSWKGQNKQHLFFIDKWILRQVASRYIPPVLYKRDKAGFPVSTAWRTEISPSYFHNSWVQQTFGLSREALDCLFEQCPRQFKTKLLHLDVWARLFLLSEKPDAIAETIVPVTRFIPE
jgi:asparagine synthase (glutamine-hydrolysing)